MGEHRDNAATLSRVLGEIMAADGFANMRQLAELARVDRLRPVLVKCNLCRFTAGAEQARTLIEYCEKAGDWCRSVELTEHDTARTHAAANAVVASILYGPNGTMPPTAREQAKAATPSPFPAHCYGNGFDFEPSDADPGL